MAEVTEVVTKFSFQGSTSPLGKYNKQLGSAIKGLTAFATVTAGALAGLSKWADSILKSVDPIAQLNRETGISVENIQSMSYASSVNGGSAQAMMSSLRKMGAVVGEVAMGTGMGKLVFEEYGLSIKDAEGNIKDGGTMFDELRQKIDALGLDKAQVQGIAKKLGLDPSTVQLLMKTNQEMDELTQRSKDFGHLTLEQIDATADYNDSLTTMNTAMDRVKQQIAVGFAPQLTNLSGAFTDLIVTNREWISDVVSDGITILIGFGKAMWNVGSIIVDVIGFFLQFKPVLAGVTVAVGVLMATFLPITSIVALVVGLILVVDDLFTAFTGGKSVIGDFFKSFGLDLKFVGDYLTWVWDVLKAIFSLDFGALGKLGKTAFKKVVGVFSQDEQTGGGATNNTDNRQVNQAINIDIKTADPESAGRAVQDGLQKQLNDAQAQTGHGGI